MKSEVPESDPKTLALTMSPDDEDDDFQNPSQAIAITQNLILSSIKNPNRSKPLKPTNGAGPPRKRQKPSVSSGKENRRGKQVAKSNLYRVSDGCGAGKGLGVERRNLVGSIGANEGRSCGLVAKDSNSVVSMQNLENVMPNSGVSIESQSLVRSVYVSDSCKSCSVDERLDSTATGSKEGDEVREEKSCVSISNSENAQSGEYHLDACEVASSLMSTESSLLEPKVDLCSLNFRDGFENTEMRMEEKNLKLVGCEDSLCSKAGIGGYYSMSIESRLLSSRAKCDSSYVGDCHRDFELGTQLNELMDLCCEIGEGGPSAGDFAFGGNGLERCELVECPLCGMNITHLSEELRQVHTNDCLDKDAAIEVVVPAAKRKSDSPPQVADVNPVTEWLRTLGLSRFEETFVREEVDWQTLQWLTEEDLLNIGVVALGPRKKIVHALKELRQKNKHGQGSDKESMNFTSNETSKTLVPGNKLITEFFQGPDIARNRPGSISNTRHGIDKTNKESTRKKAGPKGQVNKRQIRDIPPWFCVPGTPFRVDAFRFLRGDCSHWFLTHFHMDHYQGLTRNFCNGTIYCSSITAHLVNMKIGVPWERLQILPMNQKITIAGVNLTCLDANHCPGSVIILFEPPNGKVVLHTGDFRFSTALAGSAVLQSCHVDTLILDTTYCNPQYDFPKQETVIQFVIEAIQAEAFNPKTLFLIGTYTIGKERLFLEVARLLKKKVYVGAAKLRLLKCLELPEEDMQWFTANEMESHIHVVPMWTIASFKRMKHLSHQYSGRFNLIVSFSPTGWSFGKGKKKTPGRRWQQGTIIRYEVPYSEHCSFTELREFVQFISPEHIIPSVNNEGPESADSMIALLTTDP